MSQIVTLKMVNPDAVKVHTEFQVSASAVPEICRWYASFCSGDDWAIFKNGEELSLDQYGDPVE